MNKVLINDFDHSVQITYSDESGFIYTVSYIDSDNKKHTITFNDVRDYNDYLCMLIEKSLSYAK